MLQKKAETEDSENGRIMATPERDLQMGRHDGLRSGRRRSLLAKMAKPKTRNPRNRVKGRVKGVASRGFWRRKWIWITLVVLLLIPAMQVAAVPRKSLRLTRLRGQSERTLPMCRVKGFCLTRLSDCA